MIFNRIFATIYGVVFFSSLFSNSLTAVEHQPITQPIAANSVTVVVGDDGRVYSSGDALPHRGDANEGTRTHFEAIEGLNEIVSVDVDSDALDGAVALDSRGDVWLWGRYWCDAVRGKETSASHVPAKHRGLRQIKSVALGTSHLVALDTDGRVFTVGCDVDSNATGVLGNGTLQTPNPNDKNFGIVEVSGIEVATAIDANENVTLILRSDGSVWGVGSQLMLGRQLSLVSEAFLLDPDAEEELATLLPVRIAGLNDIVAISAGLRFAIALDSQGQVWGWGLNDDGQLGPVVSDTQTIAPQKLRGLTGITSIAAGRNFTLAVNQSGEVIAQGGNVYGTLGDDAGELAGAQRTIAGITGATRVFGGDYNAFAMLSGGSLVGWGSNNATIGGFYATAQQDFTPPVPVDVTLRPAPPSEVMQSGGVSGYSGF